MRRRECGESQPATGPRLCLTAFSPAFTFLGPLLGVLAAAALQNILFKVNALDPSIYFAVAALLTAVAAASCFVPARRATRVNPIIALRAE